MNIDLFESLNSSWNKNQAKKKILLYLKNRGQKLCRPFEYP